MVKLSENDLSIFESRLRSYEFAGHVIQWISLFESRLDIILTTYFVLPKSPLDDHQTSAFFDLVLSRLSFAAKIDILKNLKFRSTIRSQKGVVETLTKIRKLRNILAHNHHVNTDDLNKIRSDKWLVNFILDYPKSLSREKNALENRFNHLWNSCAKMHEHKLKEDSDYYKIIRKLNC